MSESIKKVRHQMFLEKSSFSGVLGTFYSELIITWIKQWSEKDKMKEKKFWQNNWVYAVCCKCVLKHTYKHENKKNTLLHHGRFELASFWICYRSTTWVLVTSNDNYIAISIYFIVYLNHPNIQFPICCGHVIYTIMFPKPCGWRTCVS